MKKKILACLLILFPIFSLGLVKADTEKTKYVIASDSSFAPFVFQDSSNQYTGIDMDLIKAITIQQILFLVLKNQVPFLLMKI